MIGSAMKQRRGPRNNPIGKFHHASKLTDEKVRELRRLVAKDVCVPCACKVLGLDVAVTTAWDAANYQTWKHVHD